MGGNGDQFASSSLEQADRNHWLLVAPTIDYGDWTDPNQVASEEPQLIRWLADYLDHLPDIVGMPVTTTRPAARPLARRPAGAPLCAVSARTRPGRGRARRGHLYAARSSAARGQPDPVSVRHLRHDKLSGHAFSRTRFIEDTHFWLGVGTEDNNPNDLPRAWDQYLGTTRVQRALAFQAALHDLGARSVLVAFRGERHVLSPDMATSACSFLRAWTWSSQSRTCPHARARAADRTPAARF